MDRKGCTARLPCADTAEQGGSTGPLRADSRENSLLLSRGRASHRPPAPPRPCPCSCSPSLPPIGLMIDETRPATDRTLQLPMLSPTCWIIADSTNFAVAARGRASPCSHRYCSASAVPMHDRKRRGDHLREAACAWQGQDAAGSRCWGRSRMLVLCGMCTAHFPSGGRVSAELCIIPSPSLPPQLDDVQNSYRQRSTISSRVQSLRRCAVRLQRQSRRRRGGQAVAAVAGSGACRPRMQNRAAQHTNANAHSLLTTASTRHLHPALATLRSNSVRQVMRRTSQWRRKSQMMTSASACGPRCRRRSTPATARCRPLLLRTHGTQLRPEPHHWMSTDHYTHEIIMLADFADGTHYQHKLSRFC